MNRISIANLVVHAIIGVHPHEQITEQKLSIDLSFVIDIEHAASRDALSDTYDYAKICEAIISFVKKTPCHLLETLVKKLSDHLRDCFHLSALQLTVTKFPADLQGVNVSVSVNVS